MGDVSFASVDAASALRAHVELRRAASFALGCTTTLALGAANGGYFASSWGWAIVALAASAVWALALRGVERPGCSEVVFAGGLLALSFWTALSALWGTPAAIDEAFRTLVYVSAASAALTIVRRGSAAALLAGVAAASTGLAAYALATRLFPDRIGTFDSVAVYRLATPIGYWNSLGLLCALGVLVSVGLAATSSTSIRAALAAFPVPVLLLAQYFTFSRGSALALAVGIVVAVALDRNRLRLTATLFTVGVPAGVTVLVGSQSSALTHQRAPLERAAHDGHRLAVVLLVLALAAAALSACARLVSARNVVPQRVTRAYAVILAWGAIVAVVVLLVHVGGPIDASKRAWASFSAPPTAHVDLRKRLFTFSSNGRLDLWRTAVRDGAAHPLVGSGAGSFEAYWLAHRPTQLKVRDAHSLFAETFAELGVVGLVLLVVALAAPLGAGRRRRPTATGAYVAFLVGAGVDWQWEVTSVTASGIFLGVALLVGSRPEDVRRTLRPQTRVAATVVASAVAAVGCMFLVGNMLLTRAQTAASAGRWAAAADDAARAARLLGWATGPWEQLGEAQLGQGRTAAAARSFRTALRKDAGDWNLWFDLARATSGRTRVAALAHATRLNPRSPELAAFRAEPGISISVGDAG